jgi:hypothetical protein
MWFEVEMHLNLNLENQKSGFSLAGRRLLFGPRPDAARATPARSPASPPPRPGPAGPPPLSLLPARARARWRPGRACPPRGVRMPATPRVAVRGPCAHAPLQINRAPGLHPAQPSLAPSLPPSGALHRGAPLATAHRPHLRLVPASVDRLLSIACAQSSAPSPSSPNEPRRLLVWIGKAQSSFPRRATASVPPALSSVHRLARSLSVFPILLLKFASSWRLLCARSVVGTWPAMAGWPQPPPRHRARGRRRPRSVPLGELGRASGPRPEQAGSAVPPRARSRPGTATGRLFFHGPAQSL